MPMALPISRKSSLLAALLLSAAGAHAQISLSTVVDLAQRNSGAVKVADANLQKARAVQSEVRYSSLPTAQLSTGLPAFPGAGFTGTPPSIFNISTQAVLYSIPQHRYNTAASFAAKAATSSLKDAREQAALDAALAYLELDAVTQNLLTARQQAALAERLVQIEQARTEAGVDPLSEILQARLTAAQIKLHGEQLASRALTLSQQLAALTALPADTITPDHASIPELPPVTGEPALHTTFALESAQLQAKSKAAKARGDKQMQFLPQLVFGVQYSRNTTLLNDTNSYFARPLPVNNYSSGFSVQFPIFDMASRARARESASEALLARVEAEEAQRKNELQISSLNGNLRLLSAQAEIASLKQQIAADQLKTVLTQLESGSGSETQPQSSPKAEQLARIEERNKVQEAAEAALELAKARLTLLHALGHIEDWIALAHGK